MRTGWDVGFLDHGVHRGMHRSMLGLLSASSPGARKSSAWADVSGPKDLPWTTYEPPMNQLISRSELRIIHGY